MNEQTQTHMPGNEGKCSSLCGVKKVLLLIVILLAIVLVVMSLVKRGKDNALSSPESIASPSDDSTAVIQEGLDNLGLDNGLDDELQQIENEINNL